MGLECLAASISYAVSYIYMDRFLARRGIGPVVLSACQLAAAAIMLAIALGCLWRQNAACHRRERRGDRSAGHRRDRVRVRAELPDHHQ